MKAEFDAYVSKLLTFLQTLVVEKPNGHSEQITVRIGELVNHLGNDKRLAIAAIDHLCCMEEVRLFQGKKEHHFCIKAIPQMDGQDMLVFIHMATHIRKE